MVDGGVVAAKPAKPAKKQPTAPEDGKDRHPPVCDRQPGLHASQLTSMHPSCASQLCIPATEDQRPLGYLRYSPLHLPLFIGRHVPQLREVVPAAHFSILA